MVAHKVVETKENPTIAVAINTVTGHAYVLHKQVKMTLLFQAPTAPRLTNSQSDISNVKKEDI